MSDDSVSDNMDDQDDQTEIELLRVARPRPQPSPAARELARQRVAGAVGSGNRPTFAGQETDCAPAEDPTEAVGSVVESALRLDDPLHEDRRGRQLLLAGMLIALLGGLSAWVIAERRSEDPAPMLTNEDLQDDGVDRMEFVEIETIDTPALTHWIAGGQGSPGETLELVDPQTVRWTQASGFIEVRVEDGPDGDLITATTDRPELAPSVPLWEERRDEGTVSSSVRVDPELEASIAAIEDEQWGLSPEEAEGVASEAAKVRSAQEDPLLDGARRIEDYTESLVHVSEATWDAAQLQPTESLRLERIEYPLGPLLVARDVSLQGAGSIAPFVSIVLDIAGFNDAYSPEISKRSDNEAFLRQDGRQYLRLAIHPDHDGVASNEPVWAIRDPVAGAVIVVVEDANGDGTVKLTRRFRGEIQPEKTWALTDELND